MTNDTKGKDKAKELIELIQKEVQLLTPKDRWECFKAISKYISFTILPKMSFDPVYSNTGEIIDFVLDEEDCTDFDFNKENDEK